MLAKVNQCPHDNKLKGRSNSLRLGILINYSISQFTLSLSLIDASLSSKLGGHRKSFLL
jgi:hypothetical protein